MSSIPSFEYPVPLHANVSTQLGVEMPTGSWELAYLSMTTAGVWDAMFAAACCKNKYAKAAWGVPRGEEKRESGVEVASSERLMAEVGAGWVQWAVVESGTAPLRSWQRTWDAMAGDAIVGELYALSLLPREMPYLLRINRQGVACYDLHAKHMALAGAKESAFANEALTITANLSYSFTNCNPAALVEDLSDSHFHSKHNTQSLRSRLRLFIDFPLRSSPLFLIQCSRSLPFLSLSSRSSSL